MPLYPHPQVLQLPGETHQLKPACRHHAGHWPGPSLQFKTDRGKGQDRSHSSPHLVCQPCPRGHGTPRLQHLGHHLLGATVTTPIRDRLHLAPERVPSSTRPPCTPGAQAPAHLPPDTLASKREPIALPHDKPFCEVGGSFLSEPPSPLALGVPSPKLGRPTPTAKRAFRLRSSSSFPKKASCGGKSGRKGLLPALRGTAASLTLAD